MIGQMHLLGLFEGMRSNQGAAKTYFQLSADQGYEHAIQALKELEALEAQEKLAAGPVSVSPLSSEAPVEKGSDEEGDALPSSWTRPSVDEINEAIRYINTLSSASPALPEKPKGASQAAPLSLPKDGEGVEESKGGDAQPVSDSTTRVDSLSEKPAVSEEARRAYQQHFDVLQRGADAGIPHAQYILGNVFQLGLLGVDPSVEEAKKLYEAAIAQGHIRAHLRLASILEKEFFEGGSKTQDSDDLSGPRADHPLHRSVTLYQDAAKAGHAKAHYRLSRIKGGEHWGEQTPSLYLDLVESKRHLTVAAELGLSLADRERKQRFPETPEEVAVHSDLKNLYVRELSYFQRIYDQALGAELSSSTEMLSAGAGSGTDKPLESIRSIQEFEVSKKRHLERLARHPEFFSSGDKKWILKNCQPLSLDAYTRALQDKKTKRYQLVKARYRSELSLFQKHYDQDFLGIVVTNEVLKPFNKGASSGASQASAEAVSGVGTSTDMLAGASAVIPNPFAALGGAGAAVSEAEIGGAATQMGAGVGGAGAGARGIDPFVLQPQMQKAYEKLDELQAFLNQDPSASAKDREAAIQAYRASNQQLGEGVDSSAKSTAQDVQRLEFERKTGVAAFEAAKKSHLERRLAHPDLFSRAEKKWIDAHCQPMSLYGHWDAMTSPSGSHKGKKFQLLKAHYRSELVQFQKTYEATLGAALLPKQIEKFEAAKKIHWDRGDIRGMFSKQDCAWIDAHCAPKNLEKHAAEIHIIGSHKNKAVAAIFSQDLAEFKKQYAKSLGSAVDAVTVERFEKAKALHFGRLGTYPTVYGVKERQWIAENCRPCALDLHIADINNPRAEKHRAVKGVFDAELAGFQKTYHQQFNDAVDEKKIAEFEAVKSLYRQRLIDFPLIHPHLSSQRIWINLNCQAMTLDQHQRIMRDQSSTKCVYNQAIYAQKLKAFKKKFKAETLKLLRSEGSIAIKFSADSLRDLKKEAWALYQQYPEFYKPADATWIRENCNPALPLPFVKSPQLKIESLILVLKKAKEPLAIKKAGSALSAARKEAWLVLQQSPELYKPEDRAWITENCNPAGPPAAPAVKAGRKRYEKPKAVDPERQILLAHDHLGSSGAGAGYGSTRDGDSSGPAAVAVSSGALSEKKLRGVYDFTLAAADGKDPRHASFDVAAVFQKHGVVERQASESSQANSFELGSRDRSVSGDTDNSANTAGRGMGRSA